MNKSVAAGVGAALLIALGGAFWVYSTEEQDRYAACRKSGGGALGAALGGPFELTDETGARVSSDALIDRPTLLYFGYTFCPDVCPTGAANIAVAQDILAERGIDIRTTFISVDPQRDTLERLTQFTDAMHPEMIGLSGSEEDVARAAKAYRVYYARSGDDPDYYLIDHSAFVYLTAPWAEGALTYFSHDDAPEAMADRIQCFVENAPTS